MRTTSLRRGTQMQHVSFAEHDRSQFASANHGVPPAAAMARPAQSQNAFHTNALAARSAGGPVNTAPGGFHNNSGGVPAQRGFTGSGASGGGFQPGGNSAAPAAGGTTGPLLPSPAQQARPAQQPQQFNRPAPQARPEQAPRQESHPAPQAHPAAHGEEHERR